MKHTDATRSMPRRGHGRGKREAPRAGMATQHVESKDTPEACWLPKNGVTTMSMTCRTPGLANGAVSCKEAVSLGKRGKIDPGPPRPRQNSTTHANRHYITAQGRELHGRASHAASFGPHKTTTVGPACLPCGCFCHDGEERQGKGGRSARIHRQGDNGMLRHDFLLAKG